MHLEKIEIESFKSFGAKRSLSFSRPTEDQKSCGLTILVGPNNSGKTSVLDALRLVCDDSKIFDRTQRRKDALPEIVLTRVGGKQYRISKSETSSFGILRSPTSESEFNRANIRIVSARRSWTAASDVGSHNISAYWSTQNRTRDASNHPQLLGRLIEIDGKSDIRPKLTAILKELIPNFGSWRIDRVDNQFVVEYSSPNGDWHRANLLGDGILNVFQLALGILDMEPGATLIVDEPELSLHPQGQRAVAKFLKDFSFANQVIIATHSPYFVEFETIISGGALYRFELIKGATNVHALSVELVTELKKSLNDYQRPQLLDVVAKEIFFSSAVMFVEGQEDVGLFRRVARETQRAELPIFGYGVGGVGQIERFLTMARELDVRSGALLDGTHSDKVAELRKKFRGSKIESLPTADIRDKDAQPATAAREGMFTKAGELKAKYREDFLALYDNYLKFFIAEEE